MVPSLLIAVNGHVVVVTLIGQLVDQSRISVECEDDSVYLLYYK